MGAGLRAYGLGGIGWGPSGLEASCMLRVRSAGTDCFPVCVCLAGAMPEGGGSPRGVEERALEGRAVSAKEPGSGRQSGERGSPATSGRGSVSGDGGEGEVEASALPAASEKGVCGVAGSVGATGGAGGVATARTEDDESDEEGGGVGALDAVAEGNLEDEEIEVSSKGGLTE